MRPHHFSLSRNSPTIQSLPYMRNEKRKKCPSAKDMRSEGPQIHKPQPIDDRKSKTERLTRSLLQVIMFDALLCRDDMWLLRCVANFIDGRLKLGARQPIQKRVHEPCIEN
jgi:hypothetical protein